MTTIINDLGHGMGNAWENKDWAHISDLALQRLQADYPVLSGDIKILWRSPRPFSSAVLIQVKRKAETADRPQYLIKRSHHSFRQVTDILQEHAFLQHLASKAIPVATLVTSKQNMTAIELDGWSYEVYEKAQGLDLYADQQSWKPFFYPEHAAKTGALLAKLHMATQDYAEPRGRSAHYLVSNQNFLESNNIVTAIQQRIQSSPSLTHYFKNKVLEQSFLEQISKIHQAIQPTLKNAKKIWTHNDLHASNLFWSAASAQADITAVIDFGLCDRNSALYDLAITIERNFIDWLELEHTAEIGIDEPGLTAFLNAYFKHPHPQEDFSILPELLQIVHLDFAFSELEYFLEITQNQTHADAAYDDWIIGHVDWFLSKQGQQFTQMLRRLITQEWKGSDSVHPLQTCSAIFKS